jgi:DNA-binding CsgD family transcriptional regulator
MAASPEKSRSTKLTAPTAELDDRRRADGEEGVPATERAVVKLSQRERLVAVLFAEGHSARQISATIGLSQQTVRSYLAQVRRKYKKADRRAGTVLTLRECLIQDGLIPETAREANSTISNSEESEELKSGTVSDRIPYRVIFERPADADPLEAAPLVSVFMEDGALPKTLMDPVDHNGTTIEGAWTLNGVVENHKVAFYKFAG